MADVTSLVVEFKSTGLQALTDSIGKLANAAGHSEDNVKAITKAMTELAQNADKDVAKTARAMASLAKAAGDLEKANLAATKAAEAKAKAEERAADRQEKADARAAKAIESRDNALKRQADSAEKAAAKEAATAEKAAQREQERIQRASDVKMRVDEKHIKQLELIAAKQAKYAAAEQKLTMASAATKQRADTYALNQTSLVESRTLLTHARIMQGEERLALNKEKWEAQKAKASERAAAQSTTAWQRFKDVAGSFADLTVGGFGLQAIAGNIGGVVKTADQMTLLEGRLKLATKSSQEFTQAQQTLQQSSLKNGLSLTAQIDGYTQLERSTRSMGLSVKQLSFLTESFGKAAVVSGASTESYKSALTQLNQGFASGVLRGQEFNSVAEQAPAIMEALANGLRGNNKEFDALEKKGLKGVAALREMAKEGKLVNDVTMPALLKGLEETNKQFEQMPLTVSRATESLKTAYSVWLNEQNKATNSTVSLANGIQYLANNFSSIISVAGTTALALGAVFGARLLSGALQSQRAVSLFNGVMGVTAKESRAVALAEAAREEAAFRTARANEIAAKSELDRLRATPTPANVIASADAQKKYAAAVQESFLAGGRAAKSQMEYDAAVKATTISARAAHGASVAFSSVIGALGGPVGVAITALSLLAVYWDDITNKVLGATKAHNDFMKAQNAFSVSNKGTEINAALDAQRAHTQELRKQASEIEKTIGLTARGEFRESKASIDRATLAGIKEQIRESALKEQSLQNLARERNALVTSQVQEELDTKNIKSTTTPDKPKTGTAPDQTLGTDFALSILEKRISSTQALISEQKRLAGYAQDETLTQLSSLETQKLQLQNRQELQQFAENSGKKLTADAREQLSLAHAQFQANKQNLESELAGKQSLRAINNDIDKLSKENSGLAEAANANASAQYKLTKQSLEAEQKSLEYKDLAGELSSRQVSLSKADLAYKLDEAKVRKELVALQREAAFQAEVAMRIAASGDREAIAAATEKAAQAKQAVEAKQEELRAAKGVLDVTRQQVVLQGNAFAGARKALQTYGDQVDDLYSTGKRIGEGIITNMESMFMSFFDSGKLNASKLFDFLKNEFKKIAVQQLFIKPIVAATNSMFGSSGGGSVLGSLGSGGNGFFGAGGIVTAGLNKLQGMFNASSVTPAQVTADLAYGGSGSTSAIATSQLGTMGSWASAASQALPWAALAVAASDAVKAAQEGRWGAALTGSVLGGFLDKKFGGGGAKTGGEASFNYKGEELYTPNNADMELKSSVTDFAKKLQDTAKDFGGSLANLSFAFGFDQDPKGKAGNRFKSILSVGGEQLRNALDVKFEGDVSNLMATEFKIVTVAALKKANLTGDIASELAKIDVASLTAENVDDVLSRLDYVKQLTKAFGDMGKVMPQLASLSLATKEALAEAAGGLDMFGSNLSTYYDKYFSESEKQSFALRKLTETLSGVGLAVPATKDQFRALVEAQNLTTESGRKAYTTLLSVSGAFAELADSAVGFGTVENAFSNLRKALEADYKKQETFVNNQIKLIEQARDARLKALDGELDAAKKQQDAAKKAADLLKQAAEQVDVLTLDKRRSAIAALMTGLASGGSVSGIANLEGLLSTVGKSSEDLYSSFEEYSIDAAKQAAVINKLDEKAGVQLSAAERQVSKLQEMIDVTKSNSQAQIDNLKLGLEQQRVNMETTLAKYQEQIDLLKGIKEGILSVPQAIKALESAINNISAKAAATSLPPSSSNVYTGAGTAPAGTSSPQQAVNDLYKKILGREADVGGLLAYSSSVINGTFTIQQVAESLRNSEEYKSKNMGSHAGGLAYVPSNNYPALLHKGERVLTASENENYSNMSGNDLKELIEVSRGTMFKMHAVMKILEKFDGDGLPETRSVAIT